MYSRLEIISRLRYSDCPFLPKDYCNILIRLDLPTWQEPVSMSILRFCRFSFRVGEIFLGKSIALIASSLTIFTLLCKNSKDKFTWQYKNWEKSAFQRHFDQYYGIATAKIQHLEVSQ